MAEKRSSSLTFDDDATENKKAKFETECDEELKSQCTIDQIAPVETQPDIAESPHQDQSPHQGAGSPRTAGTSPASPEPQGTQLDTPNTQGTLLDPLSYTKSEEFTSEIFKIRIRNLPKFGFNELKKRLKSHLQLNPHKIKSDKSYITYVCFTNEKDRDVALQKINGHVWKGKTLQAKIAAPVADPYLQKKQQERGDDDKSLNTGGRRSEGSGPADGKKISSETAEALLRANVSPLWDTDYPQQLQMKTDKMKATLDKVTHHHFVKHMFRNRSEHGGLPCELLPIIPSPVTSQYRNKNEFTVGYDLYGQVKVGFRYGLYKEGTTAVGDCSNLGIAMPAAIPVIQSFQKYLLQSKWLPYRQESESGHWRTLTVRTFQTGDVMAMVDFIPRKMEQTELNEVKSSLKEFFVEGDGKDVNIKSFYFRVVGVKGQTVMPSSELLFGESHVYETILDLKFRISPEAFFQVNTPATALLYQLVSDWCNVSPTTTVLDICCGTGTIGLSMAKKVQQVIGIEMCPQAVEDARFNASVNGISNATFHCAKVEDVINKVMSSVQGSVGDVVAVVDPPRPGLHKDVIRTLRRCICIHHLVYVSCNPDSALDNFVDLIRPETGRLRGPAFTMVRAVPVDLFPGTRHCELVILFTRSLSISQEMASNLTNPGNVSEKGQTDLTRSANVIEENQSNLKQPVGTSENSQSESAQPVVTSGDSQSELTQPVGTSENSQSESAQPVVTTGDRQSESKQPFGTSGKTQSESRQPVGTSNNSELNLILPVSTDVPVNPAIDSIEVSQLPLN